MKIYVIRHGETELNARGHEGLKLEIVPEYLAEIAGKLVAGDVVDVLRVVVEVVRREIHAQLPPPRHAVLAEQPVTRGPDAGHYGAGVGGLRLMPLDVAGRDDGHADHRGILE